MSQFCSRQPEACQVGSQALTHFGHKAQASAKWLYEKFTSKSEQPGTLAEPAKALSRSILAEHVDAGRHRARLARHAAATPGRGASARSSRKPVQSGYTSPRRTPISSACNGASPHDDCGHDRRHHREFRPARRVGRPLSLCDRARAHAYALARGTAHRDEQGAGLRQPGVARHEREAERRKRGRRCRSSATATRTSCAG